MPNIPTRERSASAQNPQPRQAQHNNPQMRNPSVQTRGTASTRPPQSRPQGQPQQRVQVQQMRYGQNPQIRTLTPPPSAERLRPIKPSSGSAKKVPASQKRTVQTRKKKKYGRQRERTTLGDFLLSFFVALFVFGVAAIFVCNALISLFT